MKRLLLVAAAAIGVLAAGMVTPLHAQGVTTGGLTGMVTDENGQPIEAAQVQLKNNATGRITGALTRASGLYLMQGIEPDASYSITVRRIGFEPQTRDRLTITLNQTRREDFKLSHQATVLNKIQVVSTTDPVINATKSGTGTVVSDSALHRLPTLNRNFSDFVQLVPQVSTTTGYLSGGGVNLRQNAIQIDGAQAGDLFGLGTTGQPGSQANAKSIGLDAVKSYQVLLSPFDVRQGNFGGLLINAITKSGTNDLHGSLFGYTRNQSLTRTQSYLADYSQQQYGFSLGGPIMRDKMFFFVNGEWQKLQTPALGPYIGSSDQEVGAASINQLQSIMSGYGLADVGSGNQVQKQNPNRNIFARFDAYLPFNTHFVLRHNYASADQTTFSRSVASSTNPNFNLTSNLYLFSSKTNATVAEFLTNWQNGLYNELLLNLTKTSDFRTVPVHFPQLTIKGIPRSDGGSGSANFVIGTEASSQGNTLDQRTFEITDNFTVPVGTHAFTFGVKDQFYKPINLFAQNSLGSWTFNDLASLQAGVASSYSVSAPNPADPAHGLATFHASMLGLYAQDSWQITPRLSITGGVRYDVPNFGDTPPTNASVLSDYNRDTHNVPGNGVFSPRLAFNWDVTGDQANQLRGGIGEFTGPPPFVYLSNAYGNSGITGFASLTCSGSTTGATSLAVPTFNQASITAPPTKCADAAGKAGASVANSSSINTTDPNFKFPQYIKATLGWDHRFMNDVIGTIEGLYTRSSNNVFYQNLALAGPQGTDAHGRVLYGQLTATGGTATFKATPSNRTTVLDMSNSSGDYTYSFTAQLQKAFTTNFEGSVAYTYQHAMDVTSTTSSTAGSNYRYQRDVSGDINDKSVSTSKYDQPNRIIATGTYRFPKTLTDISVVYTGNSGAPFDYVYGVGTGTGSGDANADGQSQNDLIYIPKNAHDQSEILFTGYNSTNPQTVAAANAMADGFESLINSMDCLKSQRGQIMKRNSCRNPWVNEVDLTVAQNLGWRFNNLQVRFDIINFGNLLNKNWGKQAFSDQGATCGQICSATLPGLTQTGNKLPAGVTNSPQAQGIYTFDTKFTPFNSNFAASNYRMQASIRYSF
jgi:Carboxypeptidase regulatory-like domain/TonB dependent receptor